MTFIQIIRDFFEVINTSYQSGVVQLPPNDINFQKLIEIILLFCLQNIKFFIFNFFSFEWVREVNKFQIFIPKISESILRETFFLENYNPINIGFDTYNLNINKFFIGFLNAFFLSLPFSCSQLIFLRRFLVQGTFAGISAALGNICGQILFIAPIILGVRFFIIPFFSFQALVYIFGIFLLLSGISNMAHEKSVKIIKKTDTKKLLQIFLLNFFLMLTEQNCIYQFLTNISVGAEPTILEMVTPLTTAQAMVEEGKLQVFFGFFFIHFIYLIGLFFGSIFFNFIIGLFFKNLSEYIQIRFKILKSSWILGTNFFLLSAILALTFTSIPYYTIEYLLTSPLGFISQDKALNNTIFSENNVVDSFGYLGSPSLNTDIANFDRTFYLNAPGFEAFEELNYSGEYATFVKQGFTDPEFLQKSKDIKMSLPFIDKMIEQDKNKQKAKFVDDESFESLENDESEFFSHTGKSNAEKNLSSIKSIINQHQEYPFWDGKKNTTNFDLEKRFERFYENLSNECFTMFLEETVNRFFIETNITDLDTELDTIIKQKYYSNPVYKFLLNLDIDIFLNRQFRNINENDEKELHEKRLQITRYSDTLRFYNLLPFSDEFQSLFNGTKSFADRVYNQQFKGTLRIVRELFSISFQDTILNGILKYDQPFFLNEYDEQSKKNLFHEELNFEEELILSRPVFIEVMNQDPFYIGWDENLKKIIVTNRIVSKKTAIFESTENSSYQPKQKKIFFSAWPITENNIKETDKVLFKTRKTIKGEVLNYDLIFENFDEQCQETELPLYLSLPSNLENLENLETTGFDIFPSNRGGFFWPGETIISTDFLAPFSKNKPKLNKP